MRCSLENSGPRVVCRTCGREGASVLRCRREPDDLPSALPLWLYGSNVFVIVAALASIAIIWSK